MILSLTFWKVIKSPSGEEQKKFLQTPILWHPIWKETDFWITAIYMSILEEINHQKSLKLEDHEETEDTIERYKNVVFGHLATFSNNMIAFMIEKSDVKKIVKQYCNFYNLEDNKVKELNANIEQHAKNNDYLQILASLKKVKCFFVILTWKESDPPKKIGGADVISDYFTKKTDEDKGAVGSKPLTQSILIPRSSEESNSSDDDDDEDNDDIYVDINIKKEIKPEIEPSQDLAQINHEINNGNTGQYFIFMTP